MAGNEASERGSGTVLQEVRTNRLVVVDEHGADRCIIEVVLGHAEVRVNAGSPTRSVEAILFAGEPEPGNFSAGVEVWVDGNSVGGSTAVVDHDQVDVRHFGEHASGTTAPPA